MNAVEIEESVSRLAEAPFDSANFPFAFLEAFGNKETTLKRLRSGDSNQSDIGGVLQRNNIHLKVCAEGEVTTTLAALRQSPATVRQKCKFILATDGKIFEAENIADGETVACDYPDFHNHFGFFLPLAGITTVKQIRENAFDIKATGRLNRLYIELLRENPDWGTAARREDLNHFMARLIFCFFAEDTAIFGKEVRFARIRVFDPACGSGNFLVIAYKEMRAIEAEINKRRGEAERKSEIPKTNFRGIELRNFACEIARLALIIAEYQCDVVYRGQQLALAEFLPLEKANWITCGNALRLDWLSICPPTGKGVKNRAEDLFETPLDQSEIDFENEGGETYVCGNPPYKGNARKSADQKDDLKRLFDGKVEKWGLLDYVCGWFYKSFEFARHTSAQYAFVATNSVAQGQHVSNFWRPLFEGGLRFVFAVRSFKWSNLAANDAGVTVVIIGAALEGRRAVIFDGELQISTDNINAYLLPQENHWVTSASRPISGIPPMVKGNYYGLSEHLLFSKADRDNYLSLGVQRNQVRRFYGSTEVINAKLRYCFWFEDKPDASVLGVSDVRRRMQIGAEERAKSKDAVSNGMVKRPHQFREMNRCERHFLAIPVVSSENRDYLPVDLLGNDCVISNKCFALYDTQLWNMALVASRLHWVWIGTVCVRLEMRFSYSNTLGWNTFPVPTLTEQNKADLTRCAEDILLAREAHFPATIADLYDPETMPANLREAHERNDETLERIYIGRRFKNDTERLEKLFELYTQMTANQPAAKKATGRKSNTTEA